MRPKIHQLHCQIVCRAASGARLNPKVCSCFKEEDYVGQLCRVAKLAVSSVTLSKRILQRWLLQYNAMIVQTR